MANITIYATDLATGEEFEITDLYWFEENGVHDFSGESLHGNYSFRIELKID